MAYQILGYVTSQFTGERTYSLLCDTSADLPASVDGYTVKQGWSATIVNGDEYVSKTDGTWVKQPSAGGGFTPTQEQQAALDSGIDATKVAQIATNTANIALKQNKLTTAQLNAVNSGATSAKITQITTNQSAIAGHDMEIMALSTQQSAQHTQIVAIQNQLPDFTKIFQIFGGVGATLINSGDNLNTSKYTETGCYICENGTIAASLVNSPVNYAGFVLLVYSSGNKYRIILPTSGGTPQVFIETVTGGGSSFNPWFKLVGTAI